jgi:hypothetical protein
MPAGQTFLLVQDHGLLRECQRHEETVWCRTVQLAHAAGAIVLQSGKGRAVQMNHGARRATGEILCFLHADSTPPRYDVKYICSSRLLPPDSCSRCDTEKALKLSTTVARLVLISAGA